MRPLGITNPDIHSAVGVTISITWLLCLVFLAGKAKDRNDSRLSLRFLVLLTFTFLLPVFFALIWPNEI